MSKLGVIAVLLLSFFPSAAQDGTTVVKLTVKHDGKESPAPDHITLSFDDHSLQIPVRDGRFEVSPDVTGAQKVTIATDVEGDHIKVSDLSGKMFTQENWTLLLAERKYGEDYQWNVPKGAAIRSSCILVFDSVHTDPGTVAFVRHCRSRQK
ncbi:MAG: hypothetical protein WBP79_09075 [Candidatus Acidiferrales bacterium]